MNEPNDAPDAALPGAPVPGAPLPGEVAPIDAPAESAADTSARETARIRAVELRAAQKKQDSRRTVIVRGGVVVGILVVIALVAVSLLTFARPSSRGPANMASDGIVIGPKLVAQRTPALGGDEKPVPTRTTDKNTIAIRVYVDYFQPDAAAFQKANAAQLRQWVDSGAATIELHPIAIATTGSDGAQYSLRAANAAACVADLSPDRFFAFSTALLAKQPDPKSAGLDDAAISRIAQSSKVQQLPRVRDCIQRLRFSKWVQAATARAATGPIPGSKLKSIGATPTVLLDGTPWEYSDPADARGLARAFVLANGGSFNDESTATPTPTPSPTATPAG